MAVCLRKIAPLRSIRGHVFAEDTQVVAEVEQLIQDRHGIIDAAHAGKRIYIPESTDKKRGFRHAEIVVMLVAVKQSMIRQQFFLQFLYMLFCFI